MKGWLSFVRGLYYHAKMMVKTLVMLKHSFEWIHKKAVNRLILLTHH